MPRLLQRIFIENRNAIFKSHFLDKWGKLIRFLFHCYNCKSSRNVHKSSEIRVINKIEDSNISNVYLENFDKVWSDEKILKDVTLDVLTYMDNLYKENSPEFVYYLILYHIFSEFLEDLNEDELANEKIGFKNSFAK